MTAVNQWSRMERFQYAITSWNPKFMYASHAFMYRLTNGKLGGSMRGIPVLLLTTSGRKTGQPRTKPLMYLPDGDSFVLCAANVGLEKPPVWWLNLQATPQASVQVRGRHFPVIARLASPEERKRLWPLFIGSNPFLEAFQEKTRRELDLIILQPITEKPA